MTLRAKLAGPIAGAVLAAAGAASAQTTTTATTTAPPSPPPAGATNQVGGVTVRAPPPTAPRTSIDRRSYAIGRDVQSGTLADALRNIPSVLVDPQGNLSIRGDPNVTIMVDGKPSTLFQGPGRSQALQSLPAGEFERVEVITNPSAEFTPEGTGGIINLITRRTQQPGSSGSVLANGFSDGRWIVGVNASHKSGPLTLTLNGNIIHAANRNDFTDDREALSNGAPAGDVFGQSSLRGGTTGAFARVGADYDVDAATRLSGSATYSGARNVARTDTLVTGEDATGAADLIESLDDLERTDRTFLGLESSLRHNFRGLAHDLSLSASLNVSDARADGLFSDQFLAPALPEAFNFQQPRSQLVTVDAKADYEQPAPGGAQFKVGFEDKGEIERNTDLGFVNAASPSGPDQPGQSDQFHFERWVEAAYVTYQRPFGLLTALFGLRVERSDISLDNPLIGFRGSLGDTHLFPTLHLAYDLGRGAQLLASYSERIERPAAQQFDPFQRVSTPFDLNAGNPTLEPPTTKQFEFGYDYKHDPTDLRATLFYRDNQGGVASEVTDLGGGVLLHQPHNLLASESAGVDFEAGGRITRTLTYNLSAIGSWNRIDATPLGLPAPRQNLSVVGHGQLSWQATPADLVQVFGQATSTTLQAEGEQAAWSFAALGWRHKLTPQLSLAVIAQHVFERFDVFTDTPTLAERYRLDPHLNVEMIGLTYTFGSAPRREPGFDFTAPTN